MKYFIKKNFTGFEQTFLFFLILSFFLPTFYYSYRYDHLTIYLLTIFYFLHLIFTTIKSKFDISSIKRFCYVNKSSLFVFILISIFILFALFSLLNVTLSNNFNTIKNNGLTSLVITLSNLDNYFQVICITFLSLIFFLSKDREKNINIFLFTTVSLVSLNSLYGLFELLVVNIDTNCNVFFSTKQSLFCSLISSVDRAYSGIEFSNAGIDYIDRAVVDDQIKKEMKSYTFNSSSIGWISLSAGRSSGIFNMPIQAATITGSSLFLLFILYFRNLKENTNRQISFKFFTICFFLLLIGSLIPTSRVTSHLIIPGLLIFIFIFRDKFKFLLKSNLFKFIFLIFLTLLITLGTLRWNGYNNYYTHALRYVNIFCKELAIKCEFEEQIIREKTRIQDNSYAKAKGADAQLDVFNSRSLEGTYNTDQIKILYGIQDNFERKKESPIIKKIKYYIFYLSGGRYGGEISLPLRHVLSEKKFLGFGPITKLTYDQLHYYLLYHTGLISLILFMTILFVLLFQIIKNLKILTSKFFVPTIFIYLIYFLASFGGPIFFMNRINFLFFFMMIFILTEIDKFKTNNNEI